MNIVNHDFKLLLQADTLFAFIHKNYGPFSEGETY